MEITYKASGLDALKERVDELEDAVEDIETDLASKADNSVVGTVENGTTASQPYAVGEHFIRNDKFCTAIATIASGATLTLNTNYVEGSIAECIARMGTYSTTETEIGTWNGARLYRKIVPITGGLPNNSSKNVSTGLVNANVTIRLFSAFAWSTNGNMITLPYVSLSGNHVSILKGISGTEVVFSITSISDVSSYSNGNIIIEYTKS